MYKYSMRFISKNIIKLDKELSDLDIFTIDFIKILGHYTDYVLVSGYVSILLGRARSSEDVDITIPKMNFDKFEKLLTNLKKDFYCLNAETDQEIYNYISDKIAVRFAKKGKVIPNMELKFAKNRSDMLALKTKIIIQLGTIDLSVSQLELQIAFKEQVLKSPKDIEDAHHLRQIAKGKLDVELIAKHKRILNGI